MWLEQNELPLDFDVRLWREKLLNVLESLSVQDEESKLWTNRPVVTCAMVSLRVGDVTEGRNSVASLFLTG